MILNSAIFESSEGSIWNIIIWIVVAIVIICNINNDKNWLMDRIKLSIIDTIYTRKRNIVICQLRVYVSRGAATFRSFTGVAKCSPEDNFDFNKGKKLALARAEIKARRLSL